MNPVITLTTDFGMTDAYVGIMKGVILGINPEATIVDICHTIQPQNVTQAAFVLSTAFPYFPQGTIHLMVVDPGVGTKRRAVILITPRALFVAPDNGVLSYVIKEAEPRFEAIAISNPRFWRSPVSSTFHGRDILAPVAAHLSLGIPPREFGDVIHSLSVFPRPQPYQGAEGELVGHIIHIDRFGNLITNFRADELPTGSLSIEVASHRIKGLSASYAEGGELLALIGSSGNLEVAARNGNAAGMLKANIGDEVKIKNRKQQ